MTTAPMTEHKFTITRVFDASQDLVWACWTEPKQFAAWFGPEHFHTPVESVEIDLRPGGVFRSTMVGPDGTEHPGAGTFVEVVPKERFSFTEVDIDHPMMDRQFTVISFNDLGDDRTELVIDVTMTCIDELIPMAQSGWNSTLDKLAGVLVEA
jgi:uncharacterized protein YndB with AHSA1/START domain